MQAAEGGRFLLVKLQPLINPAQDIRRHHRNLVDDDCADGPPKAHKVLKHQARGQRCVACAAIRHVLDRQVQSRVECAAIDQESSATGRRNQRDAVSFAAKQSGDGSDRRRFAAASRAMQQHARWLEVSPTHTPDEPRHDGGLLASLRAATEQCLHCFVAAIDHTKGI